MRKFLHTHRHHSMIRWESLCNTGDTQGGVAYRIFDFVLHKNAIGHHVPAGSGPHERRLLGCPPPSPRQIHSPMEIQGQNRLRFPGGVLGGQDLGAGLSTTGTNPSFYARIDKERPFPGRRTFPFCGVPRRGFLGIISGKGPDVAGIWDSAMTEISWG